MYSGKLDRRIQLVRVSRADDGFSSGGEMTETVLGSVWAEKRDVSDGERIRAQQMQASISSRFFVRYSSLTASLTTDDIVRYDGLSYEIFSIKEIGRREGFEITANARKT